MHAREPVERIPASVRKSGRAPALMTTFCAFVLIGVAAYPNVKITQIADLAKAAGKPAWLLLGFPSMISGVSTLTVYLDPDVTTERLRRGRMLHRLRSTSRPSQNAPRNPKVEVTAVDWASVLEVANRSKCPYLCR
jgi:hypothetical protein